MVEPESGRGSRTNQRIVPSGMLKSFLEHPNIGRGSTQGVGESKHYVIRTPGTTEVIRLAGLLDLLKDIYYPDYAYNTGDQRQTTAHLASRSSTNQPFAIQPRTYVSHPNLPPEPIAFQSASNSRVGVMPTLRYVRNRNALRLGNQVESALAINMATTTRRSVVLPRTFARAVRFSAQTRRQPTITRSAQFMANRMQEFIRDRLQYKQVATQVVVFDEETRLGSAIDCIYTKTGSELILGELKTGYSYRFRGNAPMRHELGDVSNCPYNQHVLQLLMYWCLIENRWHRHTHPRHSVQSNSSIVPTDATLIYGTDSETRAYRLPQWALDRRMDIFQRVIAVHRGARGVIAVSRALSSYTRSLRTATSPWREHERATREENRRHAAARRHAMR